MFLVLLDVTIINVALPTIGRQLSTGASGLQWVVDAYTMAIASLLLAGGVLGDRLGHRRIVMIGLTGFGLASAVCGLAAGPAMLIGARAVQGGGAALLLPGSIAVIADAYPEAAARARALGVWAAVSALSLPAGPLVGGLLVTAWGWRSVFLLNLPIVAVALVAVPRLVGGPHPVGGGARGRSPDLAGLIAAAATLGALVFAVITAGRTGLSAEVLAAAVVAVLAGAGFVAAERRARDPMLPPGLLRVPAFTGANAVALAMNVVGNGTIYLTTLYLQDVQGRGPLPAGLLMVPGFVPLAALSPITGRITARLGPRPPMIAGLVLGAAGVAGLTLVGPSSPYPVLLPALLGLGLGLGLLTAAVVAAAIAAVPPDRSGLASGVNNTARQTGTALGVAVFGALAGTPEHPVRFVAGMHRAGVLGAALWLAGAAVTAVTVRRSARPTVE
ncbi:MFS transporter [Rugosimonospora acidiphila]|uniref:MFS transporter n=2 Tax=Rugosimonospora acidiphila TaxID=556531 RepID=A0ABP9RV24_9ACTN